MRVRKVGFISKALAVAGIAILENALAPGAWHNLQEFSYALVQKEKMSATIINL